MLSNFKICISYKRRWLYNDNAILEFGATKQSSLSFNNTCEDPEDGIDRPKHLEIVIIISWVTVITRGFVMRVCVCWLTAREKANRFAPNVAKFAHS